MKPTRGRGDVVLPRVELETARLRLRPVCLEDAETVYASIRESIEPLARWMDWCHAGYAREDSDAWIASTRSAWEAGGAYEFLVFERSGRHVGAVGLNQFNRENNGANLGYWVRLVEPAAGLRGRGGAADRALCLRRGEVPARRDRRRGGQRGEPARRGTRRRDARVRRTQSPAAARRADRGGGALVRAG